MALQIVHHPDYDAGFAAGDAAALAERRAILFEAASDHA